MDSKWDELFPEDPEKLLDLTEESIQSLLEGVKHYNVQVPLAEVLSRLFFKEAKYIKYDLMYAKILSFKLC